MPAPACCSILNPFKKIFGRYFNIKLLIKAFFISLILSIPIYLDLPLFINSLIALLSFYLLLTIDAKKAFFVGFFTGILWFYWIGLSFRYYDLSYLIPLIIIFIGLIYGTIFFLGYYIAQKLPFSIFFKALFILFLSYIHPFKFNWFILDILLLDTIFLPNKIAFALLLLSITLFITLPKKFKILSILILFFAIEFKTQKPPLAPLKIFTATTHIPQDKKWDYRYKELLISNNFKIINMAIKEKFDIVVLPESAFALFLNKEIALVEKLKTLSKKITIITGGLYVDGLKYYNSTYLFDNGKMQIFHKAILVPFGEEIPLPKEIAKLINQIFFKGSSDYTPSKDISTYTIKDVNFTNAICYEATHPKIYEKEPKYIIAMSNNAWFIPSIEPKLQYKIIKYYAKIYNKVVYHSTNIAKSGVIR